MDPVVGGGWGPLCHLDVLPMLSSGRDAELRLLPPLRFRADELLAGHPLQLQRLKKNAAGPPRLLQHLLAGAGEKGFPTATAIYLADDARSAHENNKGSWFIE